jgi:hypothetical protein
MRYAVLLVLFFCPVLPAFGQVAPAYGQMSPASQYQTKQDTAHADSLRKDSLATAVFDKTKIKIIKRDINARKYIILAVGMMIFLALILTTVQTWNPG